MAKKDTGPKVSSGEAKPRAKFEKPRLKTESLTAVAAVCNGSTLGGRKASTGAPALCTASRLKS